MEPSAPRPGDDPVEHLQRAALDAIAAARTLLDAVEEVVADPARLRDTADLVGDVVRDGLARLTGDAPPWTAARTSDAGAPPGGAAPGGAAGGGGAATPEAAGRPDDPDAAGTPGEADPAGPAATTRPGGRVRRIPVE